jgi:cation transport ATPase
MLWRNPKEWKWKWLSWQVLAPLAGPIAVSYLVALLWETGQPNFHMNWKVIVDVTPWALTFFTMALIGSGFNDIWADLGKNQATAAFLMVDAIAVLIYTSFIVIWRHTPNFEPGTGVYVLTFILLGTSVVVCHEAAD